MIASGAGGMHAQCESRDPSACVRRDGVRGHGARGTGRRTAFRRRRIALRIQQ
ncbi:hypothetical protein [Lysobacter gummosus]|uniref:hypothetical protein n=1 Tax=Lysobacter gummosus TaxID=262324 RepID=UPI00362DC4A3